MSWRRRTVIGPTSVCRCQKYERPAGNCGTGGSGSEVRQSARLVLTFLAANASSAATAGSLAVAFATFSASFAACLASCCSAARARPASGLPCAGARPARTASASAAASRFIGSPSVAEQGRRGWPGVLATHARGGQFDRFEDLLVPGAAAEVAGQLLHDRRPIGVRVRLEQRLRGEQEPGRAVAALRRTQLR